MAILEVVSLAAKKPEELGVPGSDTEQSLTKGLRLLREKNIAGFKVAAFGPVIGEAGLAKGLVEWESVEAHMAFAHSDMLMPFFQCFAHVASPLGNFHVDFNKVPIASDGPATRRVTEFAEHAFKADAVPGDAEDLLKEYINVLADAELSGYGSSAYGWVLEERDDERVEGGKAKNLVVATGWDNKEDYENAEQASNPTVKEKKTKFAASFEAASTSLVEFKVVE